MATFQRDLKKLGNNSYDLPAKDLRHIYGGRRSCIEVARIDVLTIECTQNLNKYYNP